MLQEAHADWSGSLIAPITKNEFVINPQTLVSSMSLRVFFKYGFFWELATLIVIMLLGHWIEMKSVMGASNAFGNRSLHKHWGKESPFGERSGRI